MDVMGSHSVSTWTGCAANHSAGWGMYTYGRGGLGGGGGGGVGRGDDVLHVQLSPELLLDPVQLTLHQGR